MLKTYKVLIIEDDLLSIKILKHLLTKFFPNLELVGVARNSKEFIDMALRKAPDILLVDLDLGEEKNSLELLKEFNNLEFEIIIISSHQELAIEALNKYHISGFILKPANILNLKNAVFNAQKKIQQKYKVNCKSNFAEKIIGIPTAASIEILEVKEILYLVADGKCTEFHLTNGSFILASKNIGYYEKKLPQNLFFRTHYKFIINIKKVEAIIKIDGNYCRLLGGKSLPIAKRRNEELRRLLHLI